jgi:hypothetical protein
LPSPALFGSVVGRNLVECRSSGPPDVEPRTAPSRSTFGRHRPVPRVPRPLGFPVAPASVITSSPRPPSYGLVSGSCSPVPVAPVLWPPSSGHVLGTSSCAPSPESEPPSSSPGGKSHQPPSSRPPWPPPSGQQSSAPCAPSPVSRCLCGLRPSGLRLLGFQPRLPNPRLHPQGGRVIGLRHQANRLRH